MVHHAGTPGARARGHGPSHLTSHPCERTVREGCGRRRLRPRSAGAAKHGLSELVVIAAVSAGFGDGAGAHGLGGSLERTRQLAAIGARVACGSEWWALRISDRRERLVLVVAEGPAPISTSARRRPRWPVRPRACRGLPRAAGHAVVVAAVPCRQHSGTIPTNPCLTLISGRVVAHRRFVRTKRRARLAIWLRCLQGQE
jgi:hypothetical protein